MLDEFGVPNSMFVQITMCVWVVRMSMLSQGLIQAMTDCF